MQDINKSLSRNTKIHFLNKSLIRKSKRYSVSKSFIRIIISISIFIYIFLGCSILVQADEVDDSDVANQEQIIDEQSKIDDIGKLKDQLGRYSENGIGDIINDFNPDKIMSDATRGKFEFNITSILNNTFKFLFKEVYDNIDILLKIVILVILCAVLKNLQTSFLSDSVGEMAFYICYIVIIAIMLVSFKTAMDLCTQVIDGMVDFMHAIIPLLITLLVTGGNITSASIFQPILVMIVEVSATIMKTVFLPLIFLSTVLNIVNNVSDKIHVSKLAGFIKQICTWALCITVTAFIGIVSVQGSLGAVIDGVTSKTAKYAINAFIPIVGKYLADAADTVIGCTLLIKNAAGVAAMIGVIAICLVPLLKILALVGLYRLTCVVVEPIAEKRITNCITDVANSLTFIFAVVCAVTFMFLLTLTILISASNLSAMIR